MKGRPTRSCLTAETPRRAGKGAIGGPSPNPSRDLNDGDVIWLVPELAPDGERNRLVRGHWEVLTLEQSGEKLLAARTVRRESFEQTLRAKLRRLGGE